MDSLDKELLKYAITAFTFLIGSIISLLIYIFKNSVVKKIDTITEDLKTMDDSLNSNINTKVLNLETIFSKKIEKVEDEIKRNKIDLDQKFEKYNVDVERKLEKLDLKYEMVTKELIITQTDQKHINKRLNKIDGFDSTEY